jgi:hypothetical protein
VASTFLPMSGPWAFGLTVTAFAWGVAILAAGLPLVADESTFLLVVLGLPAAVAAGVWWMLHRRCAQGGGTAVATVLVCMLGLFSLVSLASLGLFVLPVVALLAVATILTPSAAG